MALYSDVIRDRFRRPRFRGALEHADVAGEDVNPLCGDRVRIQGRLADGRLAEARWSGDCCAIAAASADLLLEMMEGQPTSRARELTTASLLERLDSDIRSSRMKCVALPLAVLQGALAKETTR
ncbi:MAG TPA: iron-sulfur cluster assembly scaffold protein [Methylomirabilota bacterium]|nr:iron-sulfur cluster assembly scaffold protein [Methylomirabilota bacterium]